MDAPVGAEGRAAARASSEAARSPVDHASRRPRLRPPTPRVALVAAAALVVGALLYLGREAVSPFIVGLLLVYLLNPLVERVVRIGLPRWLAVLAVYIVTILVLWQAIGFAIRPLVEQVRTFATNLPTILGEAQEVYRGLDLPPALREAVDGWIAGLGQGGEGGGGFDPSVFLPVVNLTAGFISGIFGYIIIPVWAFYLLKDRPQLMRAFDRTLPGEWRADVWEVARIVERVFGQWVRGQLFLGVTVGVATFIGLMVLNVAVDPVFGRFALLLAVSAGVLELLPIIGPIIAAVPAVLLALTAGPEAAIAALLLYLLVQQIENNVLVPKIQGDAVELHPSAVMFSLVVGGAIAGLLGAILALPVTAAGRDVYRYLFHRLSQEPVDHAAAAVRDPEGARAEPPHATPAAEPRREAGVGRDRDDQADERPLGTSPAPGDT
jgi:predicted PurR-regulated permease PerM